MRDEIRSKNLLGVSEVIDELSDLRLLDMLAWTPQGDEDDAEDD